MATSKYTTDLSGDVQAADAADLSQAPTSIDDYDAKTDHFADRVGCDRRPITEALAETAIALGDVEENPVDRPFDEWRHRRRLDGIDVVVCAGESSDGSGDLVIFTAYLDVADARIACQSDTWSKKDLHTAAMLQYIGGDQRVRHLRPRNVDVYDPVEYHGHALVWNEGHTDAYCLRCERHSIDGDYWKAKSC